MKYLNGVLIASFLFVGIAVVHAQGADTNSILPEPVKAADVVIDDPVVQIVVTKETKVFEGPLSALEKQKKGLEIQIQALQERLKDLNAPISATK